METLCNRRTACAYLLCVSTMLLLIGEVNAGEYLKGERYQATVPDTLDLADRAALAIRGITNVADPDWHYFPYFNSYFNRQPPVLFHDILSDIFGAQEKFMEALPLLRIMSGSTEQLDIEKGMIQGIVDNTRGGILWADVTKGTWGDKDWLGKVEGNVTLTIHDGRMAGAAAAWYLYTKDPMWKKMAAEKIDTWYQKVRRKGDDMMYFPGGRRGHPYYVEGKGWKSEDFDDNPPREDLMIEPSHTGVIYNGWFIMGMAQAYRFFKNEKALELAEKMTNYTLHRSDVFDQYGRFRTHEQIKPEERELSGYNGHLHANLYGLLGPLEYAITVGDKAVIQYIRGIYDFGRMTGIPQIGWFPEHHSIETRSEACQIADMVAMAVKLSKAGAGDYWEDVDQYVRNQFIENQMIDSDWVAKIPEKYLHKKPVNREGGESDDRVAERSVGSWVGWAAPNDLMALDQDVPGIMQCCTGNAGRALYFAWEGILQYRNGTAQVNLLLNRASRWMDVDSYLPYEGKVILKNKTAENAAVRIPLWVDREAVKCQLGAAEVQPIWVNNFVAFTELDPQDQITITFPMVERRAKFKIATGEYTVDFRGNTAIHVEPRGVARPLYQREHYRRSQAPMKTKTRYVHPEIIDW